MRELFRLIVWLAALALIVLIASKWLLEPTYTVSSEVVVKATPARVWEKVGDLEQWPAWVKGIEGFEILKGEGRETGSLAHVQVYNGFQGWDMDVRLVEVLPPIRLRYQIIGGPQSGVQSLLQLAPSRDGTETVVSWSESHAPGGLWGNLLAVVMGSVVTTHHDESLNQLKFALERGV